MSATEFQAIADFQRQTVGESFQMFENEAPGYHSFKKETDRKKITDKGFRVPGWHERPGGHTSWTYSAPDFNSAKGPKSKSMYVFPVGYALPIQWEGSLIRALKEGSADALTSWRDFYLQYTDAATKRINHFFYGDGSGALAYSASTLAAPGAGQTLNCTTTAAATAGQTKGAKRLEVNQTYQAYNASTGAVRGTFIVTTPGASSCVVTVLSGSISSGDPLCDVGGFQKAMRGLAWLISDQNRSPFQGLNTAEFPDLNAPFVDLNGALLTPATTKSLKAALNVRNNDRNASRGLKWYVTPGQLANLESQGYGLRRYMGAAPVEGISDEYKEAGWEQVEDADLDEDRSYAAKAEKMKVFEEMPFGEYNLDGQDLRMLLGANSTGSDVYQKAIGLRGNPGIISARAVAGIKRAMTSGITTQVTAG